MIGGIAAERWLRLWILPLGPGSFPTEYGFTS